MAGLDKGYIVHKWAGIWTTIFVLLHFMMAYVPDWLVVLHIISDPGQLVDCSQYTKPELILFQTGVLFAHLLFYILLALVIIALFERFSYHFFRRSHKYFPGVFLLFAYHSATAQLKDHWLGSPGSYLLFLLLLAGCYAGFTGLFQRIGKSRKHTLVIKEIVNYEQGIIDLHLGNPGKTFVHQPGQYRFLRFEHDKEPHPFTIASASKDAVSLRFGIKASGNFTKELADHRAIGQEVEFEGPYGEFKFEDSCKRQVWVAGGIGITPFMARLEYLAQNGGSSQPIPFWYATQSEKRQIYPNSLTDSCKEAGVNFYHLDSRNNELLGTERIKNVIGDFDNVSFWFCGPPGFRQKLLEDLKFYGFDKRRFHFDVFNMR